MPAEYQICLVQPSRKDLALRKERARVAEIEKEGGARSSHNIAANSVWIGTRLAGVMATSSTHLLEEYHRIAKDTLLGER